VARRLRSIIVFNSS